MSRLYFQRLFIFRTFSTGIFKCQNLRLELQKLFFRELFLRLLTSIPYLIIKEMESGQSFPLGRENEGEKPEEERKCMRSPHLQP